MAPRALSINAKNMVPPRSELLDLGFGSDSYLCTVIQGSLTMLRNVRGVLVPGMKVMVRLNNECQEVRGDWSGLEAACQIIVDEYGDIVKVVGIGNELDLWQHLGDSHLTPEFSASLARRASPILRRGGILVAPTSLASPSWTSYLPAMVYWCRDFIDIVDLHLYAKASNGVPLNSDWQSIQDAWATAYKLSGWIPTMCSEAGIKIGDAGGLDLQARWYEGLMRWASTLYPHECPLIALFAWSDAIGTEEEQGNNAFGLRGPSGERKPSWFAVQRALGGPISSSSPAPLPENRYQLGFLKWHTLEPDLLGDPVRTEKPVGYPGWQAQRTKKGTLSWVDQRGHVFVRDDGRIWHWQEDWPHSQEI